MTDREEKINRIKSDKPAYECYKELFANSEPPADFDELLLNSPINERGQIDISFMEYEIDEDLMEEIIDKYEVKVKKHERRYFAQSILLGCSPKTKTK